MRALLDTNIIIHRETDKVINQDIGTLFRWLDRSKYIKCIHPITVDELKKYKDDDVVHTLMAKINSYEQITIPFPMARSVRSVSDKFDVTDNDKNDTKLLNELYCGRVDILISEDKKIHQKAAALGISEKVYSIDSFLEKVFSEHPDLIDYKVLNVRKVRFGNLNLQDHFFDSLKHDYPGFEKWFVRKYDEFCYVTQNSDNGLLLSFLYLKVEDVFEDYSDISPHFQPKKRMKVGTFKVISNGFRLGERFMKIIFDNALSNKVDEVYVTIFDKTNEQKRLINLLEQWGFRYWGLKGNEKIYVRDFSPQVSAENFKSTYPFVTLSHKIFLVPIYPEYHTELLPDSILRTESPLDFIEDFPHRNCISKVYVSWAKEPHPQKGDLLIFYRTGGYYKSVISTIGLVEDVKHAFLDEKDFLTYCRKSSVFPDNKLIEIWQYKSYSRPFAIRFLYEYSFPYRLNMKELIDLKILAGVDDAPRGFREITKAQFDLILQETKSDKSFIVD